ncbi:MAG: hypothetical protein ACLGQH_08290 [Acidobacteriota bacterium]
MFGHALYFGHVPLFFAVLLVVAVIITLREVRRRDDRRRDHRDAETLALLEDVKATLARLEARVESLEILLPEKPGDRNTNTWQPDASGKRGQS